MVFSESTLTSSVLEHQPIYQPEWLKHFRFSSMVVVVCCVPCLYLHCIESMADGWITAKQLQGCICGLIEPLFRHLPQENHGHPVRIADVRPRFN
jgi:hypothetical protein